MTALFTRIAGIFLLFFALAACAEGGETTESDAMPLPAPTMGDGGAVPVTPTPALITVASRSETVNPDGSVTRALTLADNSLGIGQVLVRAPGLLSMGDGGFVALTLYPSAPAVGEGVDPVTQTGGTQGTQTITQSAPIYPVMKADLTGATFAIELDGDAQRLVTTDAPTEWLWSVQPRESGAQTLVASLSIPVQVEGSDQSVSRVLQTFPLTLTVQKTFAQRIEENLEVILTTLVGVLGGGATLGWRAWRSRALPVTPTSSE